MSKVKLPYRLYVVILILLALLSGHGAAAAKDPPDPESSKNRRPHVLPTPAPMETEVSDLYRLPMDVAWNTLFSQSTLTENAPPPVFLAQSSPADDAIEDAAKPPEGKTRRSVKKDTEEILVQEGGVLIPKGTLVLEPSFNYVHIQNNKLAVKGYSIFNAILFGRFDVEKVKRNILTATLTARYGITNRLQAELFLPYVYRTEEMIIPASIVAEEGNQSASVRGNGIGDLGGSINYHAIRSRGRRPDITLNFRFKSHTGKDPFGLDTQTIAGREFPNELPTGTGFYGISGGFTMVKVSDPVVFYGSLAYAWNMERDVGGVGKIDPGDSVEYNLGMATALNEKASLSFSFQNAFTDKTTLAGNDIADSKLISASLSLGVNYRVSQKYSILGVLNVGLTDDTPDFQVQVNIPFNFNLF